MAGKVIWEKIEEYGGNPKGGPETYLFRARVPNGWLVKFVVLGEPPRTTLNFVHDPSYTWDSWE